MAEPVRLHRLDPDPGANDAVSQHSPTETPAPPPLVATDLPLDPIAAADSVMDWLQNVWVVMITPGWRQYQILILLGLVCVSFVLRLVTRQRIDSWMRSREGLPKWRLRLLIQIRNRSRSGRGCGNVHRNFLASIGQIAGPVQADQHTNLAHTWRFGTVNVGRYRVSFDLSRTAERHVLANRADQTLDHVFNRAVTIRRSC